MTSAVRMSRLLGGGTYRVVVHGGAGDLDPNVVPAHVRGCEDARDLALACLKGGGSALDAVELAVRSLEANPLFNAGTGGSLNEDGALELDASIMTSDGRAGAVAALPPFEHPISIARKILERGEHVFLVADGAARLALELGFEPRLPESMITDGARARLERARTLGARTSRRTLDPVGNTVGAVAFDRKGALASATSTGGTTNKRKGRVGDSPILGAGTYASTRGAASATGDGEAFMRMLATRTVIDRVGKEPLDAILQSVLEELEERFSGLGGLIVATPEEASVARSTRTMPWAFGSDTEASSGS